MRYEGQIYRPPGEWKSYLLQCTVGCSHNACTYCNMYKDKTYRVRPLDEVLEDINACRMMYGGTFDTVFLCDGDAINLPMDYLLAVLEKLYRVFPNLRRVGTYAGPRSTARKTPAELKQLAEAGLTRAYLGVESGDGDLLLARGKGVNAQQMLEAGQSLVEAGFDLWAILMTGLAGADPEASRRNALMSADIINRMKPRHLSCMTYMPIPGTPLYRDIEAGKFTVQSSVDSLREMRLLIEHIELDNLHFVSTHSSNYIPIKGTLKQDRDALTAQLTDIIDNEAGDHLRRTDYRHM